ncbi:39S ribosomal protein L51, mitochondrial [Trichonephila inaurata madagascariensis]|uniref:Large ribosomal subunit protein mL51 n=1 Tax=Trichonephila inaurata madagascariensis TaxID=2747483 RepID=A0A8X6YQF6_9ARAC|nr:39S ribosomal protein L51, mitochondrial [Trichonephila inaurata madagascariensis]
MFTPIKASFKPVVPLYGYFRFQSSEVGNMNNFCKQIFNNITSFNVTQVRHIRETPWKKEYLRRYGYKERFFERPDTLPRIPENHKNLKTGLDKLPEYQPYKAWSDKRKYFGQNDYIDILGDGSIHPVKLLTNMPPWLRGFQGNEFQMLLLKQTNYQHWRAAMKYNHLAKNELFDGTLCGKRFKAGMSEVRIQFLLNCLRFDAKDTRIERKEKDEFAPIRKIWDDFI